MKFKKEDSRLMEVVRLHIALRHTDVITRNKLNRTAYSVIAISINYSHYFNVLLENKIKRYVKKCNIASFYALHHFSLEAREACTPLKFSCFHANYFILLKQTSDSCECINQIIGIILQCADAAFFIASAGNISRGLSRGDTRDVN